MVDYASAIETAQRLLAGSGRAVTLLKLGTTPKDPAKPWDGPADPRGTPDATLDIFATFVGPNSLGLSATTDDMIKRSKQVMIVSPGADVDVRIFDEVYDNGVYWKIAETDGVKGVEILRPGDDVVMAYIGVSR